MRIECKVANVTGADGGIGRESALSCAGTGGHLVLSGLSAEGPAATQDTIATLPEAWRDMA